MTQTIHTANRPFLTTDPDPGSQTEIDAVVGERLRTLEEEIFTLRETMGRFADLVLGDLKKIRETSAQPRSIPMTVPLPSGVPRADSTASEASKRVRNRWMLWDILAEFRIAAQLYFDPTYRMSRTARFLIPGMLVLFLANYLLLAQIFPLPIVGPILGKIIDVFLVIVLYRIVSREVIRYREAMAGIAEWLRATATESRRSIVSDEGPATRLEME